MLLRNKTTGAIHRARIAPLAWTVVVEHEDGEEVYEVPTCSPDDYGVEIASASPEEVASMREHGILPEEPLLVMEDDRGFRHVVHLDFAPLLRWADGSARGPEDFPGRIVKASAAGVAILRRFSLDLPGLDDVEKRQRRLARRSNNPGRRTPQRSPRRVAAAGGSPF